MPRWIDGKLVKGTFSMNGRTETVPQPAYYIPESVPAFWWRHIKRLWTWARTYNTPQAREQRQINRENDRALRREMREFQRIYDITPAHLPASERLTLAGDMMFVDDMAMKARDRASNLYINCGYTPKAAMDKVELETAISIRSVAGYEVAKMFRHHWKTMYVSEKLTPEALLKLHDETMPDVMHHAATAYLRERKRRGTA